MPSTPCVARKLARHGSLCETGAEKGTAGRRRTEVAMPAEGLVAAHFTGR